MSVIKFEEIIKNKIQNEKKVSKLEQKFDEIYFKSLKTTLESKEYKNNQIDINFMRNFLIKEFNIPTQFLDIYAEKHQENVAIEYENAKNEIIKYLSEKIDNNSKKM